MILPRRELSAILSGLVKLDGDEKEKTSYRFDLKVKYGISKNIAKLMSRVRTIETTKLKMIRDLSPDTFKLSPDTPEMRKFTLQWEEFLDGSEEIAGLFQIKRSTLDAGPDKNNIPNSVLAQLDPIIIEDDFTPTAA